MPDGLRDEADVIIIEIKCTINAMHWNHPETIPSYSLTPQFMGKFIFHETGPWCQKCWGPLPERLEILFF